MENETITCPACKKKFPKSLNYKHCTNCFACTGCEIYYCPYCDERIEIIPCKKFDAPKPDNQEIN